MKKTILILSILLLTSACNKDTSGTIPENLESLKTSLAEKKADLATLQTEIKTITEKIMTLDPSLQEKARLVDTLHLITRDFDRYIRVQGTVTTDDIANAVSEVPGRITKILVKEGNYVKKGQLLATLDLESLGKQIAEIETSLSLAKDVFVRQERLWNQKIGSEIQYLQAKNNVAQLEQSLETIRHQQTKANVFAPISGYVDVEYLKQGEVANPGMPILQILNTNNLKVITDLPEQYLKIAKKGAAVDLEFPSLDLHMTGKITMLGRSINPSNRTLQLEIKPTKHSPLLKPNLLAEIKLRELTKEDVISIPLQSIMQEVDGTEYVYTAQIQEDNTWRASKSYIITGEATDNNIIVSQGLTTEDILVTTGTRNLSDQQLIALNNIPNE